MKYTVIKLESDPRDLKLVVDVVEEPSREYFLNHNVLVIFRGDLREAVINVNSKGEISEHVRQLPTERPTP